VSSVPTTSFYPGDAYVDIVGMDVYGAPVYVDNSPNLTSSGPNDFELTTAMAFALAHNKPFALAETGAGSTDATFPSNLATAISSAGVGVAFINMWDANTSSGNLKWDQSASASAAWRNVLTAATQVCSAASGGGGGGGGVCVNSSSTPPATSVSWDGAPNGSYASGKAPPVGSPPNFTLNYETDFSAPLDSSWTAASAPPGGSSMATYDPAACVESNGVMQLITADQGGGNFTSCMIKRANTQAYGKYLIRFKSDLGTYESPAAALWGPAAGMDFMFEDWNGTLGQMQGDYIDPSGTSYSTSTTAADFTNQWHTMGVEWTPGSIVYTIDGTVWATQAVGTGNPMALQIMNELINIDPTTPATSTFYVNWVAVYAYTLGSASSCQ
jgi:hypothetical protein